MTQSAGAGSSHCHSTDFYRGNKKFAYRENPIGGQMCLVRACCAIWIQLEHRVDGKTGTAPT
ncbi:hypothetical protein T265_12047 [Opisthorchis viverrini]|uniref:Uncharacterized protein n=1 Tax=Opisthorchis viverrini TaxID=6198 RepID=A0A074YWH0_OPIVI|nr:hypothetical protein T265_12047 [Opisthorchis viverrini]KER19028.1 hypothetical protein T265_12047 [Opisthorchis viverrini]